MSEAEKMAAFGFPVDFSSTKGKKVDDKSANMAHARLRTKRTYRQYMNRMGIIFLLSVLLCTQTKKYVISGGFNRPLDASH